MNNDLHARMAQYERELLNLRQRSQPTPSPEPTPVPPVETAPVSPAETTLHILVGNKAGNTPIHNAVVTVDRQTTSGRLPLYVRFTDRYGQIEPLTLPTDRSTQYVITAAAPGFLRATADEVIAGGGVIREEMWLQPLATNEEAVR